MTTKLDKRFFGSSRGQIVTLLRSGTKTVNELAEELGLTDNAVRAHLLSLERDGLVKQSGIQRGVRKPHFSYQLTEEADQLFPKAYDALLNQLIAALKHRLSPAALEEVLREVGRALASAPGPDHNKDQLEESLGEALHALESLGGAARVEREGNKIFISSDRCALANAVAEHPEVCKLAETLLTEIIGTEVREQCDRKPSPSCRFEIIEK